MNFLFQYGVLELNISSSQRKNTYFFNQTKVLMCLMNAQPFHLTTFTHNASLLPNFDSLMLQFSSPPPPFPIISPFSNISI